MFNKVTLVGRLGAEPEVGAIPSSGKRVANFTVATSHSYKDAQGNRQEETEWHRIVVFNGLCDVVQKYLHKGSKVFIEGRLRTRQYQDKQGNDRYITEVICNELKMLDSAQQGQNQQQTQQQGQQQYQQQTQQPHSQEHMARQPPAQMQQQTAPAQQGQPQYQQPQQTQQQPVNSYAQAKAPSF